MCIHVYVFSSMSIYWSPRMYILSSIKPRCVYRYTCIRIYMPMSKYRCIGKYTNPTDVYKTHEYIRMWRTNADLLTHLLLIGTYMCLYVPIHTSHVHVSELINLCPCIRRTWNGSGLNLDLCAQTEGLKASRAYPALFPSEFSSILSNTPSERKDLF